MGLLKFEPKFFKVRELKSKLGINSILKNSEGVVVTYNQLMKSKAVFKFIFIFDEASIEVPSLILYCNHFGVEIFKLLEEEVSEIREVVKHAQMVGIPKDLALGLPHKFEQSLSEAGRDCAEIALDLLQIDLGSV